MKNLFSNTLLMSVLLGVAGSANAVLPVSKVPEPSGLGLMGVALLVTAIIGRKK